MALNLNKVTYNSKGILCIKKQDYDAFLKHYDLTCLGKKRLGHHFYDYFDLAKLKNLPPEVSNIFAKDGETAKASILAAFNIT
jgi:hypothetical protein